MSGGVVMLPWLLITFLVPIACWETSIYGRLWSAVAFWALPDPTIKYPSLAMRAPSMVHVPAALTTNWVFAIDGTANALHAVTWRNRAVTNWTSAPIVGLNTSLPVLSVEAGPFPADSVYLLDPGSGRLHAYAPTAGPDPVWVSDFVCSQEEGAQHQWLGASTAAGVVVARCAGGLAAVDLKTGHLKFTIKGRTLPPAAPVPFLSPSVVGTWRGGSMVACSLTRGSIVPWSYTHPSPAALITSVAPSASGVVALTVNGTNATDTLTLLSAQGRLLSTFTLTPDAAEGLSPLSILPTPTMHKGVLYGIATALKPDPLGVGEPAKTWFAFAVNVSDPRQPSLLWRSSVAAGWPIPQKVQLSKRSVFISVQGRNFVFNALVRETGQFAWDNTGFMSRLGPSNRNITIAAPTYCCESVVVSIQNEPDIHPNYTMWGHYQLNQDVVPLPGVTTCFCNE